MWYYYLPDYLPEKTAKWLGQHPLVFKIYAFCVIPALLFWIAILLVESVFLIVPPIGMFLEWLGFWEDLKWFIPFIFGLGLLRAAHAIVRWSAKKFVGR